MSIITTMKRASEFGSNTPMELEMHSPQISPSRDMWIRIDIPLKTKIGRSEKMLQLTIAISILCFVGEFLSGSTKEKRISTESMKIDIEVETLVVSLK